MSAKVCPAMDALSAWYSALLVIVDLLLVAFLLAVAVLWRAQRADALTVSISAMSALLAVAAEVTSVVLWLRVRATMAELVPSPFASTPRSV
jgi:hypothetical protein